MLRFSGAIVALLAALAALPAGAAETPKSYPNAGGRLVWDRVRFVPAPGHQRDMVGGKLSGSNVSATEGYELLAEITSVPPAGQWTELSFDGKRPHRWLRYEAPPGSFGHISKIEFFAGQRRLMGPTFGSIGCNVIGHHWPRVFDDRDEQHREFLESDVPDGQYVGMDVGDFATPPRPVMDPPPGEFKGPLRVTLKSRMPGAIIRYTLDGTLPGPTSGLVYQEPITVADVMTIVAVSCKEGFAPSPPVDGTYLLGPSLKPGLGTFHIGNSLTQTTHFFPKYAQTAGYTPTDHRFLKPGIWTNAIWEKFVAKGDEEWKKTLASLTAVDHFTCQPRDPDVAREAKYDILFFDLVREKFPAMQPWFYSEWTDRLRDRPWDRGQVPSTQMKTVYPAFTWEESASAMLVYNEDLQRKVCETYKAGKRPRVLPTVLAVGWIKNWLDHGKVPGLGPKDFDEIMFHDCVHPGPIGAYLIDMVWYAAMYRQSPVGRVLPVGTSLTAAQAAALQRLAWDVVKNYPDCGLYEEGSARAGRPQFSLPAGKISAITRVMLSSATPGAWFRYTLDGSTPTRTRGYVYCGIVSLQPGMTLKAVAYKSGMADSEVAEAAYPDSQQTFELPPIPENVVLERDIQYGQAGEHPLVMDIVRPNAESRKPRPVIMYIHGGGWAGGDKATRIGLLLPFAASGQYFCASANYRLSGQSPWPAQLYDCKAAVRWLKVNAGKLNIDPKKIGVWGESAGGHLVTMLGLTADRPELEGTSGSLGPSSCVACVVDFCGPSDLVAFFEHLLNGRDSSEGVARLFGEPWRPVARRASPLHNVAAGAPPFLIAHGTADPTVLPSQADNLYAALKKASIDAKLIKVEGSGHGIGGPELLGRVRAFFDKHLRGQAVEVSDATIPPPQRQHGRTSAR